MTFEELARKAGDAELVVPRRFFGGETVWCVAAARVGSFALLPATATDVMAAGRKSGWVVTHAGTGLKLGKVVDKRTGLGFLAALRDVRAESAADITVNEERLKSLAFRWTGDVLTGKYRATEWVTP